MADIVQAMEELFIHRPDAYAIQLDGLNEYKVIKEPISKETIANHLSGKITIGAFQIKPDDNTVKWICFDFDGELDEELEKAKKLYGKLKEQGYSPLLEFSGRRGYHVWLFVEPVDASIAKKFAAEVSGGCKPHEIFPKQDKIEKTGFGGQVKLPLGVHRANMKWSSLFDERFYLLDPSGSKEHLAKFSRNPKDKIRARGLRDYLK